MKRLIFILLTIITASSAFAQQNSDDLVQFSGVVLSADSSTVIPYATITNVSNKNQVNLSNYKGYFSFVAHERDTLRFTSIGYSSTVVIIPSNVKDHSYTLQVKLNGKSINLPVVHVFPWATTDEFKKDFMTMKIADDDLEIARKNLSGKSIASLGRTLPRDSKEIQNAWSQGETQNLMNQHSYTNPLFNPFAWGAFIKEITAGNKSRGVSDN
ncbi:MAG: carboxypeptidase-like regulatory domain-containing protein [Mucilaginibacter sp.]|uniref:carboxypeptidase-like regulatory domain-containing protein n=1 Tax=Mucilaginibacter sp. TaxID=1882438 RepID=UPI0032661262